MEGGGSPPVRCRASPYVAGGDGGWRWCRRLGIGHFVECPSGGPDGPVVGEVDRSGIELLEGISPGRDVGKGLTVTVTTGSPRELVGRVLRRRVVALPGHDHRPVPLADDQ